MTQSAFLFKAVTLIACDGFFVRCADTQIDFMDVVRNRPIDTSAQQRRAEAKSPICLQYADAELDRIGFSFQWATFTASKTDDMVIDFGDEKDTVVRVVVCLNHPFARMRIKIGLTRFTV